MLFWKLTCSIKGSSSFTLWEPRTGQVITLMLATRTTVRRTALLLLLFLSLTLVRKGNYIPKQNTCHMFRVNHSFNTFDYTSFYFLWIFPVAANLRFHTVYSFYQPGKLAYGVVDGKGYLVSADTGKSKTLTTAQHGYAFSDNTRARVAYNGMHLEIMGIAINIFLYARCFIPLYTYCRWWTWYYYNGPHSSVSNTR